MLQALVQFLTCEKTKGGSRITARSVIVGLAMFIAVKQSTQDNRLARIEARLGITNPPVTVTIPFVSLNTNSATIVNL